MTTLADLKTVLARDLQDASNATFSPTDLGDFINSALTELGRVAPARFIEDVTPLADTLSYVLQSAVFSAPVPELEIQRVELWDGSTTPDTYLGKLFPVRTERDRTSAAGWEFVAGTLYVSNKIEGQVDPAVHYYKVFGYRPYAKLTSDSDTVGVSNEVEEAVRELARIHGIRRLVANRTLFAQWQTRSRNTDTTFAGLLNDLNMATTEWRKKVKEIYVIRELD